MPKTDKTPEFGEVRIHSTDELAFNFEHLSVRAAGKLTPLLVGWNEKNVRDLAKLFGDGLLEKAPVTFDYGDEDAWLDVSLRFYRQVQNDLLWEIRNFPLG